MFILIWVTSIFCWATEIFRQVAQELPKYLKICPALPRILTSECHALGKEAIAAYLKCRKFDTAGTRGARTPEC